MPYDLSAVKSRRRYFHSKPVLVNPHTADRFFCEADGIRQIFPSLKKRLHNFDLLQMVIYVMSNHTKKGLKDISQTIWWSNAALAERLGISDKAVSRTINVLVAQGFLLRKVKRYGVRETALSKELIDAIKTYCEGKKTQRADLIKLKDRLRMAAKLNADQNEPPPAKEGDPKPPPPKLSNLYLLAREVLDDIFNPKLKHNSGMPFVNFRDLNSTAAQIAKEFDAEEIEQLHEDIFAHRKKLKFSRANVIGHLLKIKRARNDE